MSDHCQRLEVLRNGVNWGEGECKKQEKLNNNKEEQKMSKRITVTLSDKAEKYFNEVAYSLDDGSGKVATYSDVLNHCLEELAVWEVLSDGNEDLTSFMSSMWPDDYQKAIKKQEE
jgi:hypothetical protein